MKKIFLIFPVHLYEKKDLLLSGEYDIYLLEEPRFFTDIKYHKLKLAYHRATMRLYYDNLKKLTDNTKYIEYNDINDDFYNNISKKYIEVHIYDPNDNILLKKLKKSVKNRIIHKNHNFLIDKDTILENKDKFYKNNRYDFMNFYKFQRKRLNILIDKNNKPIGDKWTFDKDNRKKVPHDIKLPEMYPIIKNKYTEEAIKYTDINFSKNYGSLENFIYPISHLDAKEWLIKFLKNKFEDFGPYEDAVLKDNNFLWHSILSPMMNIGLLTDSEVLEETIKYENKVQIASYEGFIRQIIGWRNYIYTIYLLEGDHIRKLNYLNASWTLTKKQYAKFWNGSTQIEPIDDAIININQYAYVHHIIRLMYLGNFLLMLGINPNNVYQLFMEWTIDAYDWVMVPNVYSMSQYADGGIVMTRPYFSSSNYIIKMSDYKKGDWSVMYDKIYYNFINNNYKILKGNYATSRQVAHWDKKSAKEKKEILDTVSHYIENF